ncbi:hypothetical protein [Hahella chejuensis]|uniref:hypothetical protein n=1 Tax=Hahella chejuensis TaxID=158327 RepID=UPI00030C740E|nr:hypothetical protein [Hahella chejuensis]
MKDRNHDDSDLVNFVKSLPSVKHLKVYAPGEAEKLPPEQLSPAVRRLLIRERNTSKR